jgi:hypothetical protein
MKKATILFTVLFFACIAIGLCAATTTETASITDTATTTEKQEEVVAIFTGAGSRQTAPFVVTKRWKIEWESPQDKYPLIYIWDMAQKGIGSCNGASRGVSYYYTTGEYYLRLIITGPWVIKITYQ